MQYFDKNTAIKRLTKFSRKCFFVFFIFFIFLKCFTWQLLYEKCVFVVEKSECLKIVSE
jgi:hypothetical protein